VTRKGDDCWLEPTPGRAAVMINGTEATSTTRLQPGDTFEVGEFSFAFKLEP
jgi:hypothetical protein